MPCLIQSGFSEADQQRRGYTGAVGFCCRLFFLFGFNEKWKVWANFYWLPDNPAKLMIENTVNKALRVMGYDAWVAACGYGFAQSLCRNAKYMLTSVTIGAFIGLRSSI